jgi:hypothetical protein
VSHHHHDPGHAHPSPRVAPSLLRISVVAVLVAALWGAVAWALA